MAAVKYIADFVQQGTVQTSGVNGVLCSRSGIDAFHVNPSGYLIRDVANTLRFVNGGLLIEPAATNLLPYSQQSGSGWTTSSITGGTRYVQSLSLSAGTYTFSLAQSHVSLKRVAVIISGTGVSTGTATYIDYSVQYPSRLFRLISINATTTVTITIDVFGGFFDYAQVETGTKGTSVINTFGATGTRNADVVYMDIYQTGYQNWFNKYSGTFFCVGTHNNLGTQENCLYLRNVAASGNLLNLGMSRNPTFAMSAKIGTSYSDYTFFSSCDNPGQQFAAAMSYVSGQQFASLNGRTPLSPSTLQTNSTFDFSTCDKIWIGSEQGTANFFNGVIQKFGFYDIPFSQNDLNNMTK
jgi:hypothetical protein